MKKKHICYVGNFNDLKFEGLITLLRSMRNYFSKKHSISFNKPHNCDIIHIHSSGFYEALKYRKLKGKKIYSLYSNITLNPVKRIHGLYQLYRYFYSYRDDKMGLVDRIIKTCMSLISDCIPLFLKSHFLGKMDIVALPNRWLKDKLHLPNSVVIPQGVDIRKFRPMKVGKGKKTTVRYFGHYSLGKGILEVVSAFSQLDTNAYVKEIFPTFTTNRLVSYIKKKDPSIYVGGFIKDIVKMYSSSDIIVLPYRHELGAIATPLTLIEAMACECAVITSDLPHLREICGDSVVYVKPYNAQDLVKAIEQLRKDPKKRKMLGKKARERIVKHYNQEDMFKAYDKLYQKIISSQ